MAKCPHCKQDTEILLPIRKVIKKQRFDDFKDDWICPECWASEIDLWDGIETEEEGDCKPPCFGSYQPQDAVCIQCEHEVECQEMTKEKGEEGKI